MHMLEQDTPNIIQQFDGHTQAITCIEYCSVLNTVITGSFDKTVRVWIAETGQCVNVLEGHTRAVWCAVVYDTTYVNTKCKLIFFSCFNNTDLSRAVQITQRECGMCSRASACTHSKDTRILCGVWHSTAIQLSAGVAIQQCAFGVDRTTWMNVNEC